MAVSEKWFLTLQIEARLLLTIKLSPVKDKRQNSDVSTDTVDDAKLSIYM